MAIRTVLVHVDDSAGADARIAAAIELARHWGAHLTGLATSGISRTLLPALPPEQDDPTLAAHLGYVRERARAALQRFSAQCVAAGLPDFEARLVDDAAAPGLGLQARTADLTVLSQPDPEQAGNLAADVVVQAGTPVLLLPFVGAGTVLPLIGPHVMLAWDASREAARALHAALPLLLQARHVTLATVDTVPPNHASLDARQTDPLAFLARHGIAATRALRTLDAPRLPQRRHSVGEALLSLASETGAEWLVMGAYAHSRLRETLLGGVTRTVLDKMTLPVLMVH